MRCGNPFAFRPGPVSFWTTAIYIALIIPLIYVHETVPDAPKEHGLGVGIDLTEAWSDLQNITDKFHPFNSEENDVVREYLVRRAKQILDRNKVDYTVVQPVLQGDFMAAFNKTETDNNTELAPKFAPAPKRSPGATLFDDQSSNLTWVIQGARKLGSRVGEDKWMAQYFEGNNFYVYIHGKDDPEGDWWLSANPFKKFRSKGGVLVNCHWDSVPTAYGATDDAIACVAMLQMLSHFTSKDLQPTNGIVLLFNNAEEDGLLGAKAFGYSPLLQFCHTFVNLEGAGAGGRALLFRATDLQVTEAYRKTPHPFGSVVVHNVFEQGWMQSGTDYSVWKDVFGQRGLDIAFYAPRSRYHTEDDDVRHASINSLWHMLSAALFSTQSLSETTGTVFTGPRPDKRKDKVDSGKPADGVWFDMFGDAWATFALKGLFAWSLTLLVATPLILIAITYILKRYDKYYFFTSDVKNPDDFDEEEPVQFGGWKGFFRYPFALIFSIGLTVGSVFLLVKFNPFIIYSCGYSVWAMTMSICYFSFWLIMRGASVVRPSALHRGYVNIWLFSFGWVAQVAAAVLEDRKHIAALYPTVFLQSGVFLALVISLLEQCALLGKHEFAAQLRDAHQDRDFPARIGSFPVTGLDGEQGDEQGDDQGEPEGDDGENDAPEVATETTPLRAGEPGYGSSNQQTSFANTYRRSIPEGSPSSPSIGSYQPYGHEQSWSGRLPSWTWFLQFLLLAPVPLIMIGNLGLVSMSALQMIGVDGSSLILPVLAIGLTSILLLLPMTPFIHRVTHHLPLFLLCVFICTLSYNLVVFPFSASHRFKFGFQQIIDLDRKTNVVSLTGIEEYTRKVIDSVPIAAGKTMKCEGNELMKNLKDCTFDASGLPPNLVPGKKLSDLVTVKVEENNAARAKVMIDAIDTRVCSLEFTGLVYNYEVEGGNPIDTRFGGLPAEGGLSNIELWRRDRSVPWNVTLYLTEAGRDLTKATQKVSKKGSKKDSKKGSKKGSKASEPVRVAGPMTMTVNCGWSDGNDPNVIPVFHQLRQYMPPWAVVNKKHWALVEVRKSVQIGR